MRHDDHNRCHHCPRRMMIVTTEKLGLVDVVFVVPIDPPLLLWLHIQDELLQLQLLHLPEFVVPLGLLIMWDLFLIYLYLFIFLVKAM